MVETEGVDWAKYRVKVARQNLRHSKANTDAVKVELRQAKLALKDEKIQVREHKRRGKSVRRHERRRSKGLFETRAGFERRQRIEAVEAEPLR